MTSSGEAPLRLGIVGLGRAAMSMLPSVLTHPAVSVVAVADTDRDRADRFGADYGVKAHGDAAALAADGDVEAIYVASPHEHHVAHALAAIEHGRHVLVEKPLALSVAECDRIVDAARAGAVHVVVGHTHGFDRPVLHLRELVQSGAYGPLRMIWTGNYTDFLYRPRRPAELDTARGGGVLFNQLPHQLDVVRTIHPTGHVSSVRAHAAWFDPGRPTEGAYTALVAFDDGAAASLTYSGHAHFDSDAWFGGVSEMGKPIGPDRMAATRRRLAAISHADADADADAEAEAALRHSTGYDGRARLDAEVDDLATAPPHFGVLVASLAGADVVTGPAGLTIHADDGITDVPLEPAPGRGPKAGVLDELVAAVRHDVAPLHDAAWGRSTVAACLAVLASARSRREVSLDGVGAIASIAQALEVAVPC